MEFITEILTSMAPHVHFISFGLLLLAGLNLPVSEDLVFIVSASIAATIVPENKYLIFAGCFVGAYFSDIIAFSIGKFFGPVLIKMEYFRKKGFQQKVFRMEKYFKKYGSKTLFFGRFIPFGVRNILFMTSGLVNMDPKKFLLIDFIALIFTSAILFSLGFSFGKNYTVIFPYLNQYKLIIFSIFLTAIVTIFVKNKYFKKK